METCFTPGCGRERRRWDGIGMGWDWDGIEEVIGVGIWDRLG